MGMGIDMEPSAMNFSSFADSNRRPISHTRSSGDIATARSLRRRKEMKCNSDPKMTLYSDHSVQSSGYIFKLPKSIHGPIHDFIPSLYKRKSHTKSTHNASFSANGDMTGGMDLLQALRFQRLEGTRGFAAENISNFEALSIRCPQKTTKNIFFYRADNLSRPSEIKFSCRNNNPSPSQCQVNSVWKGILDTKDIFKLDYAPCAQVEINHDANSIGRSDSSITIDSILVG